MRILIDAHAFIWFVQGDPKLSATARAAMGDENNELLFSLANCWENAIKSGSGKLQLGESAETFIEREPRLNDIRPFPIEWRHIVVVETLPRHRADPFDRILIAQAIVEQLPIVTADTWFANYPVRVIW